MKKYIVLALMLCGFLSWSPSNAQNVVFERYFEDATLRIDYWRVGNRTSDSIQHVSLSERIPQWSGSLTQLLDPFDNGHYRVVILSANGLELYSRGYNSLFREYTETPQGAEDVAAYQEVLRIPFPKNAVDICWQKRGGDQKYHTQYVYHFDPVYERDRLAKRSVTRSELSRVELQVKGDVHKKIDVVIVPEGYGSADSAKMMGDMALFCDFLLGQQPFNSRRDDFNVWGVKGFGDESGITDPTRNIEVNSLVGASYNTFEADRYLMTSQIFRLHDVIGRAPCDHIIIMANSTTYGGGAIYNFYAISSLNEMARMVLPHELGHSIGGLADEYVDEDLSYGDMHALAVEPHEPNITTLVDFASKWMEMLPSGTPIPTPADNGVPRKENGPLGVYEGAGYHSKGIYRPVMHCMMRDYAPFCPVCAKRLNDIFDLYTK